MKNKQLFSTLSLALIFLLYGCKKICDDTHQPPPPKNDTTKCSIKKITGIWEAGINIEGSQYNLKATLLFSYNAAGNPVSITTQDTVKTNNIEWFKTPALPYRIFRYDNQNRLTDLIEPFNPTLSLDRGYRTWHRYGYNNSNQIIADTTFDPGYEYNGRPDGAPLPVKNFVYDAEGRILPPDWFVLSRGGNKYDSLGNYSFTDEASYPYDTSATNFLQTNKIWMFLGMNYSKNVYQSAFEVYPYFTNFNASRLPTYYTDSTFTADPEYFTSPYYNTILTYFFTLNWLQMQIEYECTCDCDDRLPKTKNM